jgi:hypothetical protein
LMEEPSLLYDDAGRADSSQQRTPLPRAALTATMAPAPGGATAAATGQHSSSNGDGSIKHIKHAAGSSVKRSSGDEADGGEQIAARVRRAWRFVSLTVCFFSNPCQKTAKRTNTRTHHATVDPEPAAGEPVPAAAAAQLVARPRGGRLAARQAAHPRAGCGARLPGDFGKDDSIAALMRITRKQTVLHQPQTRSPPR